MITLNQSPQTLTLKQKQPAQSSNSSFKNNLPNVSRQLTQDHLSFSGNGSESSFKPGKLAALATALLLLAGCGPRAQKMTSPEIEENYGVRTALKIENINAHQDRMHAEYGRFEREDELQLREERSYEMPIQRLSDATGSLMPTQSQGAPNTVDINPILDQLIADCNSVTYSVDRDDDDRLFTEDHDFIVPGENTLGDIRITTYDPSKVSEHLENNPNKSKIDFPTTLKASCFVLADDAADDPSINIGPFNIELD